MPAHQDKKQRCVEIKQDREPYDYDGGEYPITDYAELIRIYFEAQEERERNADLA